MKRRFLAIGGLLLPEDPAWEFRKPNEVIVGRRKDGPGRLEILHALQDTLPQPVTHDFCISVLRFMLVASEEPTDRQLGESVCGPFGAATFHRPNEIVRGWYCRRLPGLVYGMYIAPASEARSPAYQLVSRQCAYIMAEVLFDRVGWDAPDDPLTKVLLENFQRLERHD